MVTVTQYPTHRPGEAPPKPDRDPHGVQQFASQPVPDTCPPNMVRDPGTGECIPEDQEQ